MPMPPIPPSAPYLTSMAAQSLLKPYNRSVAVLGDSISQHNSLNGNAGANSNGTWNASLYGNRYISFGYMSWLRYLSRNAFDFDGNSNFGVVGDTTAQILARTAAALTASNAATWFVMGGINDRGASPLTLAQSQSNIAAIVQMVLNAGRIVVLMVPTGSGDTSNTGQRLTSTQLLIHQQFRRWLFETYSATPGVILVDTWPAYTDPASTLGDNIVGRTYDGLHPSPDGAFRLASLLLPVANMLFPPRSFLPASASDVYDATNNPNGALNLNPLFTGTGGTAGTQGSGTIATSWLGTNGGETSHTRVYSQPSATSFNSVTYPGGISKTWQQCVVAGTPSSTADVNLLYQSVSSLVVNGVYRAQAEIEVDSGSTGIIALFLRVYNSSDFTIGGIDMHYSGSQLYLPNVAHGGTLLTPPIQWAGPTTGATVALTARLASGVAAALTVRARSMSFVRLS